MKKTISIISFMVIGSAHAQHSIRGRFQNEDAAPARNVVLELLKKADSAKIKSGFTGKDGSFELSDVAGGQYLLHYTPPGATGFFKDLRVQDTDVDLGMIRIESDLREIREVKITGRKPLFEPRIDRIVVNVQENLSLAGGTALEALTRSPGISINREKNTISLNGKEGVLVMLDGKISRIPADALMQMLEGMPAQNVDKIELITNPSAKYDAGSTGGIINIVGLRGKNDGVNGSYSLIGGWGGKERLGATGNINYRKGNLNVYSDIAYYRNHNKQSYTIERRIDNNGIYTNHVFTDRDPLTDYFTAKIGADYSVSKTTMVGGFISGMADIFHLNANTATLNNNNGAASSVLTGNRESNNWSNITLDAYLNQKLNHGQELNFDLSYLHYYNINKLTNLNNYYGPGDALVLSEKLDGHKDAPVDSWIGTADYSNKLAKNLTLELGAKESYSRYRNTINVDRNSSPDNTLTQVFRLTENVTALYANTNYKVSEKTSLQAGLRYEKFDLNSESTLTGSIKRNSGDFFPSIFLSHDLDSKNTLQLSYSRRVERPAYNDFAPYYVFIDPSTAFTGNTHLDQALIDSYKFDYKHSDILFSLQYSHEDNGIARFQPQADLASNTLFFSSINMKYKDLYLASVSFPLKITKWLNMQNNVMAGRQVFRTQGFPADVTLKNNYLDLNSTLSFSLPDKWSAELSGFYHTAQLYGVSHNKEFGDLNAAIGKKIDDRNNFRLAVNNILGTYKDWDIVDNPSFRYYMNAGYNMTPFMVRLTYTRKFGSKKNSSLRAKDANVEDIQNRVR